MYCDIITSIQTTRSIRLTISLFTMASILRRSLTRTGQVLARGTQHQKYAIFYQQLHSSTVVSQGLTSRLSVANNITSQTATVSHGIVSRSFCTLRQSYRYYSSVTSALRSAIQNKSPSSDSSSATLLKVPATPVVTQVCGMKLKGVLTKRCEHCRITKRKGETYVLCKENPRHRQKLIKVKKWYLPGVWVNKWY